MKKAVRAIVAFALMTLMVASFASCGGNGNDAASVGSKAVTAQANNVTSAQSGENNAQSSTASAKTGVSSKALLKEGVSEWEEFLTDYEAWADNYISVTKKYKNNLTDASLVSEYIKLTQQATSLSQKAQKMEKQLASSPAAQKEFAERIAKITKKITTAVK